MVKCVTIEAITTAMRRSIVLPSRANWSTKEIDFLKRNSAGKTVPEITDALNKFIDSPRGRSPSAVRQKLWLLHLKYVKRKEARPWTEAEIKYIDAHLDDTASAVGKALKRTIAAANERMRRRRQELGLQQKRSELKLYDKPKKVQVTMWLDVTEEPDNPGETSNLAFLAKLKKDMLKRGVKNTSLEAGGISGDTVGHVALFREMQP